jgi:DNA-binding transcriptional ArsR family regulator
MPEKTEKNTANGGWKVCTSIAMELDIAISSLSGFKTGIIMTQELSDLLRKVPASFKREMKQLPIKKNKNNALLEITAYMAGVLTEDNYNRSSQAMRDLTSQEALKHMMKNYSSLKIKPDKSLSAEDQLLYLELRWLFTLYQSIGNTLKGDSKIIQQFNLDCQHALSILYDGKYHSQFWRWLDRFYYEFYAPWREKRLPYIEAQKEKANTALGGGQSVKHMIPTDWLPSVNPLVNLNSIKEASRSGKYQVIFWAEPFGLSNFWSIHPDQIWVSFAELGIPFADLEGQIIDLARRASALGDPTRLTILRLIRHFGLDNTEIASYLGLARPTVSIHAKILRDAGLINSQQIGREIRHEIKWDEIRRLIKDLEQLLEMPNK